MMAFFRARKFSFRQTTHLRLIATTALAITSLVWLATAIPAGALTTTHRLSTAKRIGPDAVWKQALTDQLQAWKGCRRPVPGVDRACFVRFIRAHGASTQAVSFFDSTGSYLIAFVDTGKVDLGYMLSSFPANDDLNYLLLNSAQPYFHPPLPSLAAPSYAKLRRAYRLASGATGLTAETDSILPWLETSTTLHGGDSEIVLQFQLYDRCAACTTPYRARAAYRFSARGKFLGAVPLNPCLSADRQGLAATVQEPVCPPAHRA